ncbi:MAG: threonylcarbamoyl-AMP synthase [Sphingomonadaceae bacterium]|nr:threonylcarbamoyl-AMP synthase [Sphingomonadaceae bacterium]
MSKTRVLTYGPEAIAEAVALIRAGRPVAVPTETVYGLAADATNGEAVARIYEAKGRPSFNPLIVHVLDLAAAEQFGVFDERARALASEYWPGPLTLVVPRRANCRVASLATAGLETIAIRVPAHRAMRALLEATGVPLAAPSANASGRISPTRVEHVLATLDGRIAMIISDGACAVGIESTIVTTAGGGVCVLRSGPVLVTSSIDKTDVEALPMAPGQAARHYAPTKPLRIGAVAARQDEWHVGFGAVAGNASLSPTGDLVEAAACLFGVMHDADQSAQNRIAVAPVPHIGLGIAINDRLVRAAAIS